MSALNEELCHIVGMSMMLDYPVIIVGSGPIGLACAISAQRRGLTPLVIDAGSLAHSIWRYPNGMSFFTTPERLEIGGHPLTTSGAKATREEALKYYRGVARTEGLQLRLWTRLTGAIRENGRVLCRLQGPDGPEQLQTDRLVLATGYFEHPNLLNVPGEELPHVSHWFDEAHLSAGQDVLFVGGKNSAVEAALQCFRAGGRVTLVHRGEALKPTVKYWLRPDFENRVKAGEIRARFNSRVTRITASEVSITNLAGCTEVLPARRVYLMTGYHPDFSLLEGMGIQLDQEGRPRLNPENLESNIPGIHVAGSAGAGTRTSEVFIENGRWDGEKIFGDPAAQQEAERLYHAFPRPVGE